MKASQSPTTGRPSRSSEKAAQSPARQLSGFLAKYAPEVATVAKAALARMRRLLPGAVELVYDNYNALAIGFAPADRTSDAVFSIAVYPRWVSLFFVKGAHLPDPEKLLKGSGNQVRHIVLEPVALLDRPGVRRLIWRALQDAGTVFDGRGRRRTIIKSISARQRPRRPK